MKFNKLFLKLLKEEYVTPTPELAAKYAKEALLIINDYILNKNINKIKSNFDLVSKLTQIESITNNFKNTASGRLLIFLRTGGATNLFKSDLESLITAAIPELNDIISGKIKYKMKNFSV